MALPKQDPIGYYVEHIEALVTAADALLALHDIASPSELLALKNGLAAATCKAKKEIFEID